MVSFLKNLFYWLFGYSVSKPVEIPQPLYIPKSFKPIYPTCKKVGVYVFNPILESGKSLINTMSYNPVHYLAGEYMRILPELSNLKADYEVIEFKHIDALPEKMDGFIYKPEELLAVLNNRGYGAHTPDTADYLKMLNTNGIMDKVKAKDIDEVWLFGPPYGGFYESREIGRFARWCNSPALQLNDVDNFIVMGFNYERGLGEMLEDFGHRCESLLENEKGFSEWLEVYGTVHRLPEDTEDYIWQDWRLLPTISRYQKIQFMRIISTVTRYVRFFSPCKNFFTNTLSNT